MHLLSYAYILTHTDELLDMRDINTRQHEGKMFLIYKLNHFRCVHDPSYRAITAWNQQPIHTRNVTSKDKLLTALKANIENPYIKVYA